MNPIFDTGISLLLGAGALVLLPALARRSKPVWAGVWLIALGSLGCVGLAVWWRALEFVPPFIWLMRGWTEIILAGPLGVLLLGIPGVQLASREKRQAMLVCIVLFVGYASIWPLLAPAFSRLEFEGFRTHVDSNEVCLQNSGYTSGPAAAVTALRKLGIRAEEGDLAIRARTSSALGTAPDTLARTLARLYGGEGLVCEFRPFTSVTELRDAGLTLAVLKYSFFVDHYVAVLGCEEDHVIVGDPLVGLARMTHAQFAGRWRFVGITLARGDGLGTP